MAKGFAKSEKQADCGRTYLHTGHLFRTERGKVKACDGSLTKRDKSTRSS